MHAKMMALCRYPVIVALLFSLVAISSVGGCGTSSMGSYRSSFQSTNEPKYNMFEWRFDLFNSAYQKVEKEDWENNEPG
jgi:hypothetical protein